MVVRCFLRVVVCSVLVVFPAFSGAQAFAAGTLEWARGEGDGGATKATGFFYAAGLKRYVNSFTSYQFPNPFSPQQDPLSRLEFPMDQWFGGLSVGYWAPSWRMSRQGWMNINREGGLKMQDSDWEDPTAPNQKTVFSESRCRLNRGCEVDFAIDTATPLEKLLPVRPIFGYRYDNFTFTTHDGLQTSLDGDSADLPGDGIDFKQTYHQYYVGVVYRSLMDSRGTVAGLPAFDVELQADYAVVAAKNEDLHLLRAGERITVEQTSGHCWHGAVRATAAVSAGVRAGVAFDFKRLLTNGSHQLTNPLFSLDFSFSGSKVWSDQAAISGYLEMRF
jgi:hypothetical protein